MPIYTTGPSGIDPLYQSRTVGVNIKLHDIPFLDDNPMKGLDLERVGEALKQEFIKCAKELLQKNA